jgi:hypothetical protein
MDMMKTPFALLAFGVLLATPAFAQSTDDRVRLSFGAGLTAGAIDGEPSIAASAGYRFADHFVFDVEVTLADEAANRFAFPLGSFGTGVDFGRLTGGRNIPLQNVVRALPATSIFPIPIEGTDDGSTLLMTAGFRYEFPVHGTRFRPYVSGGMGLARTEERFNIRLASTPQTTTVRTDAITARVTSSSVSISDIDDEFSHTGMMGSAGVGASLRVFKELSIDLNARYFRLDRDRNLGSFGGGVSYRF